MALGGDKQQQVGGDGSTNIQSKSVTIHQQYGMTDSEVEALIESRIAENMQELQELTITAQETGTTRRADFSRQLVQRASTKPDAVPGFADPDVQANIIAAGVGYARSGDKTQGEILLELVTERAASKTGELRASILNGAIETAARLTDRDLASAALLMLWSKVIFNPAVDAGEESRTALLDHLESATEPFIDRAHTSSIAYLHLAGMGIGNVTPVSPTTISSHLGYGYPGQFSRLFEPGQLADKWRDSAIAARIFEPTPSGEYRVLCSTPALLNERIASRDDLAPYAQILRDLQTSQVLSEAEILKIVQEHGPWINRLEAVWKSGEMNTVRLTAAGIAIGYTEMKRCLPQMDADLSIWIRED